MGLVSDGIDHIRVFGLTAGISSNGSGIEEPLAAVVTWVSGHFDKFHQIYVNGKLAGVTANFNQRKIVVPVRSGRRGIRLEVYAIPANERWSDFGNEIDSVSLSGQLGLNWVKKQSLPFEGRAHIYGDNGNGQIDYSESLTDEDIVIWPCRDDKNGFGMSMFGRADFGYDGSGAIGFGKGRFGYGEFGFDADVDEWISGELGTGEYKFGIRVRDASGVVCGTCETETAAVVAAAGGAGDLNVNSYDSVSNELVLRID